MAQCLVYTDACASLSYLAWLVYSLCVFRCAQAYRLGGEGVRMVSIGSGYQHRLDLDIFNFPDQIKFLRMSAYIV